MEIAAIVFNNSSLDSLLFSETLSTFIVGHSMFSPRITSNFEYNDIVNLSKKTKKHNKKIYILIDSLFESSQITSLKSYISEIIKIDIDAILFSDFAVYSIALSLGVESLLIYSPNTLVTNNYDSLYFGEENINGIVISNTITLDDIVSICNDKSVKHLIYGHGHLIMFHSKRKLLSNFLKYNKAFKKEFICNNNMYLKEHIRDEYYPVIENTSGTHIYREKLISSFDEFRILNNCIDVFIIDGFKFSNEYISDVLSIYNDLNSLIDVSDKIIRLKHNYGVSFDSGFYYKKTVYRKEVGESK